MDFFLGFLGIGAIYVIVILLAIPFLNEFIIQRIPIFMQYAIFFAFDIWAIRYVFMKGMRVIAYGMITIILFPLFVLGACFGAFY